MYAPDDAASTPKSQPRAKIPARFFGHHLRQQDCRHCASCGMATGIGITVGGRWCERRTGRGRIMRRCVLFARPARHQRLHPARWMNSAVQHEWPGPLPTILAHSGCELHIARDLAEETGDAWQLRGIDSQHASKRADIRRRIRFSKPHAFGTACALIFQHRFQIPALCLRTRRRSGGAIKHMRSRRNCRAKYRAHPTAPRRALPNMPAMPRRRNTPENRRRFTSGREPLRTSAFTAS